MQKEAETYLGADEGDWVLLGADVSDGKLTLMFGPKQTPRHMWMEYTLADEELQALQEFAVFGSTVDEIAQPSNKRSRAMQPVICLLFARGPSAGGNPVDVTAHRDTSLRAKNFR